MNIIKSDIRKCVILHLGKDRPVQSGQWSVQEAALYDPGGQTAEQEMGMCSSVKEGDKELQLCQQGLASECRGMIPALHQCRTVSRPQHSRTRKSVIHSLH